jgi:hypothetical protein
MGMSAQRFLASVPSNQDGLAVDTKLPDHTALPSSAYRDLGTPYSAVSYKPSISPPNSELCFSVANMAWKVSSFNVPANCDSTLLTPVSVAGSPPLQHRSKLVHPYCQPSTPNHQQPTPPASSGMHWSPAYEMSGPPSQTGSPLSVHPAVSDSHFEMAYITSNNESRTKEEDIPPPHGEPFFGSFGVSGTTSEPEPMDPRQQLYMQPPYYTSFVHQNPLMIGQRPSPGMMMSVQQLMSRPLAPAAPTLQHPDPEYYRHQRRTSNEQVAAGHYSPYPPPNASAKRKDGRANKVTKRQARFKRPSSATHAVDCQEHRQSAESEKDKQAGLERLMGRVRKGCPEEERWLIEMKYALREYRGKSHWSRVSEAYEHRFGKKVETACLQMRHNRAKAKWIDWAPEEVCT